MIIPDYRSSNQYYVCKLRQKPIPWKIFDDSKIEDPSCLFYGKVFRIIEKKFNLNGFTFYLTWNIDKLPSYGNKIVAIVMGDEWCRIPTYSHRIKAVFHCYGTQPMLGCNPFLNPSYLNLLTSIHFLKIWTSGLPRRLKYFTKTKIIRQSYTVNETLLHDNIYPIPLGYYKQLNIPIKSIENRSLDVFFAGSLIQKKYPAISLKRWIVSPKLISRNNMISSVEKLKKKYSNIKFELSITSGFHETSDIDVINYSEKIMDSKICLVPRGTSFETFRFFEAMRAGCIVVVEALPSRWFYDGSPAIRIDDWNDLGELLEKFIGNKQLMKDKHQKSLNWWKTMCSEDTVAKYIAEKLISIPSTPN